MTLVRSKIVHIHPTRLCNLECAHCYSASGPKQPGFLPAEVILNVTGELRSAGYDRISLSGGEPSIYPDIETLCAGLKQQGFPVSIISNGWKVDRLIPLIDAELIDEISFSFDGLVKGHDSVRGREGAFNRALSSIVQFNDTSAVVGALISVSKNSMVDLPDLVDLLVKHGLERVQFHPLASTGRALDNKSSLIELSEHELLSLLMLTRVFEGLYGNVQFHCDAVAKQQLPWFLIPKEGELISPLVITETGRILPISYDMPASLSLGDVNNGYVKPVIDKAYATLFEQALSICRDKKATSFYSELISVATETTKFDAHNEMIGINI